MQYLPIIMGHDLSAVEPAIRIGESRKYPLEKMVTRKFNSAPPAA